MANDTITAIQTLINREDVSISANIEEKYIVTTEDKIKLLYIEYNEAKKYSGIFLSVVGIFITIIISLLTCNFHDVSFMHSGTIKGVFIVAAVFGFVACIISAIQWYKNRERLKYTYFIGKIKGSE